MYIGTVLRVSGHVWRSNMLMKAVLKPNYKRPKVTRQRQKESNVNIGIHDGEILVYDMDKWK